MTIESPCINICQLDASGEICTGCHRTLDEIVAWSGLSPEVRRRIMAELPARGARAAAAPSR